MVAVFVVGDPLARLARQRLVARGLAGVAGDRLCPGESLEGKRRDPSPRRRPPPRRTRGSGGRGRAPAPRARARCRRARPATHRERGSPRADLAPVVAGGVRGVNHLVVLLRRAVRQLDQRPDVVEEIDGELTALLLRIGALPSWWSAMWPRSYAIPSFELRQQGDGWGEKTADALWVTRTRGTAMSDVTAPSDVADPWRSATPRSARACGSSSGKSSRSRGAARRCTPDRLRAGREATPRPTPHSSPSRRCRRRNESCRSTPRAPLAARRAPRRAHAAGASRAGLRRGCAAAYSAMTNFGTTVDQASTTSSCISSRLIASSRTWTQLKRMFDASGKENFPGSDSTSASRSSFGNENPITVWSWENESQTIWPTRNLSRP